MFGRKKNKELEKRITALEKQLQEQPKIERVRGAKIPNQYQVKIT